MRDIFHIFQRSLIVGIAGLFVFGVSAAPRKVRVSDSTEADALIAKGGKLIADYGAFRLIEVDESPATNLKSGLPQAVDELDVIELNAGHLNTRSAEVKALRKSVGAFVGKKLHLVHFAGPIKPEWRAALEDAGAQIVSYIPQNAYLIYGDAAALTQMQAWAGGANVVQWEGQYADDYKIHPRARLTDANGLPQNFLTDTFAVQLMGDDSANAATLALIDQLKLEPIKQQYHLLDYLNVIVRLPPARLKEIATQPEVISIQLYLEPKKRDERQDQIIAGNIIGTGPSGPGYLSWLGGKGFTQTQFATSGFAVDVSDSGIDNGTTTPGHFGLYTSGNPSLTSRVIYNRVEGTPNPQSTKQGCDGHGNLNTHIIAGYNNFGLGFPHTDSIGFHYGLGVCPFVKVGSSVVFDPDNYTFPNFTTLQSQAYQDGARISANSWGAAVGGAYNTDSQSYDALVRDAQPSGSAFPAAGNQQMVIVFPAGNNGPGGQTVGSPGTGKNVITVGASENVHSHSPANGGTDASGNDRCAVPDTGADNLNDIIDFSSRGPCVDGRMKPDLVAPGTHVTGGVGQTSATTNGTGTAISCFTASGVCALPGGGGVGNPDNFFPLGQQFYTTSSGTSHSTPAVAGACALLRQYFINKALLPPSPAMTKAYLMNSTRYLTGVDANDNLWSTNQGMGELNLGVAFDGLPRILQDQVPTNKFTATGQTRVFTGRVADPTKPFRVTLAWTDAPGSTTGNAYNNDLDLTVTIGGNTYRGNVFSGAFSVTGGAADPRNNVESVSLPAGQSNSFTVTVTAANINSDGVPNESPATDQDFALVVYNAIGTPAVAASGASVTAESCLPGNGSVDAGETVTVNFAFSNIGTADLTNLVVTLLQTNGVQSPSGAQLYGALPAGGAAVSRPFTFSAIGSCGGTINPTFQIQEGPASLGAISTTILLGASVVTNRSFTNATSITIPNSGSGSIYPSTITVASLTGTVTSVKVTLQGLTHSNPDDIDALLVGPGGQKSMLISDCGGSAPINNVSLTFDNSAASALPDATTFSSGTYLPTDFSTSTDVFASPAPAGPYTANLGVFNGVNPNGTWSLYIRDDAAGGSGSLAQGWTMTIATSNFVCCSSAANMSDLGITSVISPNPVNIGSNVTITVSVTNLGPNTCSLANVTNLLPAGLNFISATPSQGAASNNAGTVSCNLGALANNSSAQIVINAAAVSTGSLTNKAGVSSATSDPVSGNNNTTFVLSVNSFPTISVITNQVTSEDTSTGPIAFLIGDAETAAGSLTLGKFSSDTNLLPVANIVFGGSGSNRTVTLTPATNAFGSATVTVSVSDGFAAVSNSFLLTVNAVNDAPVLAVISNRTIIEGQTLIITNIVSDIDSPANQRTFGLLGAPTNSAINLTNGVFTWTPTEAQGPSTNVFAIFVNDNGTPNLSATQSVTVIVLETNSAPVLAAISNYTIVEGQLLAITNNASDPDLPPNALSYQLATNNLPVGAQINPTNGVFTWTPSESQGPSTNQISVIVQDNGIPSLSATQSFTVFVLESNTPPTLAVISNFTIFEGQTLTFTNSSTDADLPANLLTFSLATNTAPAGAVMGSSSGVFTWTPSEAQGPGTNLIVVIVSDNGVPSMSATQSFTVTVLETNSAPVLSSISNYTIFEGQLLTITNSASDSDLPPNTLSYLLATNSLAAGAQINGTNGVFTWVPSESQGPSTNQFSVIVQDNGVPSLSATQSFTVIVLETNSPPTLAAISNFTIFEGQMLTFTNFATDADVPANLLTFSLDTNTAPAGAAIGTSSGVFTWTPSEAQGPGTNVIAVVVSDNGVSSMSATQSFTVTVLETNNAPVLSSISNYTIFEGQLLTITNSASDSDLPPNTLNYQLATNSLAAGAQINGTNGVFTWVPSESQGPSTNQFSVIVQDNGVPSLSATQSFTIIVLETNSPPMLAAISNFTIFEGQTLAFTNAATDPDLPANLLTFSLDTNTAPAGAAIGTSSGVFTWTPSEAQGPGTNVIAVVVSDNGVPSMSATQSFTVTVLETNSAPSLTTISNYTIFEGETLTFTNFATDADLPPQSLTYSLGQSPTNTAINPTNGVFTWTPTEEQGPGTNVIEVLVTDNGSPSLTATQSFTVVVLETNSPPVFAPVPPELLNQTIFEGQTLLFTNNASDPDLPANALTFSLAGAPVGAQINPTNGLFTWTPDASQAPSSNQIAMVVTDDGIPSLSATQYLTVNVLKSNHPPVLASISDRIVHAGSIVTLTNSASDPDTNALTFSLDAGAPAGANIGATNGAFIWPTSDADTGTTNGIVVRVTDNGVPSLSATQSFVVTVLSRPLIQSIALSNDVVQLTWSAIAGETYRMQSKLALEQTNWSDLVPDVTATNFNATGYDTVGAGGQRFYRVMLVP